MKLSTKYLINIVVSVLFFPLAFIVVNFVYYITLTYIIDQQNHIYYEQTKLETVWKQDTKRWSGQSDTEILEDFQNNQQYKHSNITWITDDGNVLYSSANATKLSKPSLNITEVTEWTKKASEQNLVISGYIKGSQHQGYSFLETPYSIVGSQWEIMRKKYAPFWFLGFLLICLLFVFNSWIFFSKIQKRLVRLQDHMQKVDQDGIPKIMKVRHEDELGQVEHSFNNMVNKLKESKDKEKEETELRKKLIADLSHDLRTPLTVIRSHAFILDHEQLSEKGNHSVQMINDKITHMGELIDNLSSFSLLVAGKLPIHMQPTDTVKLIRSSLTSWYPLFEKERFDINIDLQHPLHWEIDELWFKRILDNIFQNILRHASSGKYISVETYQKDQSYGILIKDHGPGLDSFSDHKGAGIGLSIIEMMCKQMDLSYKIDSDEQGTEIIINARTSLDPIHTRKVLTSLRC